MKKIIAFFAIISSIFSTSNVVHAQFGIISTVAGSGRGGYSGDGGIATAAKLRANSCVWLDHAGNLFIADQGNNVIRKVSSSGIITTVAGTGTAGYSGDGGPATAARLSYTQGVATDNAGNIYIADQHNTCIRKVDVSGIITSLTSSSGGFSGDGGPATAARVNQPSAVATDNVGNVYISDQNNNCIRKINTAGIISTVAGTGSSVYSGDGGPATAAGIDYPENIAIDNSGNLYIAEFQSSRIRKVNTSGIITTIAGTGVSGHSGDGGPATAAEIGHHWGGVAVNNRGDVFLADLYEDYIRKIDAFGIITTIGGNGTSGYSGDGGPATAAALSGPCAIFADSLNNVYFSDQSNDVVRKISFSPTYTADSFSVFISSSCTGVGIVILPTNPSSSLHIQTWFGDGTNQTDALSSHAGYFSLSHTYNCTGNYTVKHTLYNGTIPIDSISYNYHYTLCNVFPVNFYYDFNADCVKDSSDMPNTNPVLVEVDSNGHAIDTVSATSGLYYVAYGVAGDIYRFKILSAPAGFLPCPSTGIIQDTLVYGVNLTKNIGFTCSGSSDFDLAIHVLYHWANTTDQRITCYASNSTCLPVNATVTMNVNTRYTNIVQIYPTPTTTVGNTLTWDFAGLWNQRNSQSIRLLPYTLSVMPVGDTIHTTIKITPYIGDSDTSNNVVVIVDTVQAGYDPNEMSVTPSCVQSDSIPVLLQYTIHFENTGNDTAHNIYVMDTLSDDVNISTMRMLFSSNEMYLSKLKDALGHNILKFDFPQINLLDSSHHDQCDGGVIFTIDTKPGLPNGTHIYNRAGIYFDINPVVMTNQVDNEIGCSTATTTGITSAQSEVGSPLVYPNPTADMLNINADNNVFESYTITNSIGKTVLTDKLTQSQTQVNIKDQPAGLYFVIIKGEQGTVVRKFAKM